MNLHKSRYACLSKSHLQCFRLLSLLFLAIEVTIFIVSFPVNTMMGQPPLEALVFYYSFWACWIAIISKVLFIIGTFKKSWTKPAFLSVEISLAVNIVVVIFFWSVGWSGVKDDVKDFPKEKAMIWLTFEACLHSTPSILTILDIIITDLKIQTSHWWIIFLVFFPGYTIANYIGGQVFGPVLGHPGSVYGFENWDKWPYLMVVAGFVIGILQVLLYCLAAKILNSFKSNGSLTESEESQLMAQERLNKVNDAQTVQR